MIQEADEPIAAKDPISVSKKKASRRQSLKSFSCLTVPPFSILEQLENLNEVPANVSAYHQAPVRPAGGASCQAALGSATSSGQNSTSSLIANTRCEEQVTRSYLINIASTPTSLVHPLSFSLLPVFHQMTPGKEIIPGPDASFLREIMSLSILDQEGVLRTTIRRADLESV